MTLKFESKGSVSIDRLHGIEIRQPRILPGGEPGEVEYQYSILINDESDGLGFYGSYTPSVVDGVSGATSKLLLTPDDVLKHLFGIQAKIGDRDHPFSFLCAFARGLIGVYDSGIFNNENSQFLVLANADDLIRLGVEVPMSHPRTEQGQLILAELFVPYVHSRNVPG